MRLKTTSESIYGFKNYLRYWEKSPNASLTLYTGNAIHLQDKKFFDDVKVIANAFDLLQHHYDLPAEFKRDFGREENWQSLAELVATTGSFERTFRLSAFKNFSGLDNFQKWLLWLRCKLQGSGYVSRCAKLSNSPEEFVTQIYELIFSCDDEKFFDERREILLLMKTFPPETFLERVRQSDKRLALKILTDNSHAERLLIFETLQRFRFKESDTARKILQRTFPQLANYLSEGAEGLTEEQTEYFRRYRWLKVTNQLTEDFNRRVKEIARNAERNIYALKSRNEIVSEEYSNAAAIFLSTDSVQNTLSFLRLTFRRLEKIFLSNIRSAVAICLP